MNDISLVSIKKLFPLCLIFLNLFLTSCQQVEDDMSPSGRERGSATISSEPSVEEGKLKSNERGLEKANNSTIAIENEISELLPYCTKSFEDYYLGEELSEVNDLIAKTYGKSRPKISKYWPRAHGLILSGSDPMTVDFLDLSRSKLNNIFNESDAAEDFPKPSLGMMDFYISIYDDGKKLPLLYFDLYSQFFPDGYLEDRDKIESPKTLIKHFLYSLEDGELEEIDHPHEDNWVQPIKKLAQEEKEYRYSFYEYEGRFFVLDKTRERSVLSFNADHFWIDQIDRFQDSILFRLCRVKESHRNPPAPTVENPYQEPLNKYVDIQYVLIIDGEMTLMPQVFGTDAIDLAFFGDDAEIIMNVFDEIDHRYMRWRELRPLNRICVYKRK